jgi:hypothetical protein
MTAVSLPKLGSVSGPWREKGTVLCKLIVYQAPKLQLPCHYENVVGF